MMLRMILQGGKGARIGQFITYQFRIGGKTEMNAVGLGK